MLITVQMDVNVKFFKRFLFASGRTQGYTYCRLKALVLLYNEQRIVLDGHSKKSLDNGQTMCLNRAQKNDELPRTAKPC